MNVLMLYFYNIKPMHTMLSLVVLWSRQWNL